MLIQPHVTFDDVVCGAVEFHRSTPLGAKYQLQLSLYYTVQFNSYETEHLREAFLQNCS